MYETQRMISQFLEIGFSLCALSPLVIQFTYFYTHSNTSTHTHKRALHLINVARVARASRRRTRPHTAQESDARPRMRLLLLPVSGCWMLLLFAAANPVWSAHAPCCVANRTERLGSDLLTESKSLSFRVRNVCAQATRARAS